MKISKKGSLLLALGIVSAIAAVGGYAYFTSTGSGTGATTVGTSTAWQVDTFATAGGPLTPGGAAGTYATVDYTAKNNSTGLQNLASVTVKVAGAAGVAWTSQTDPLKPACTPSDFALSSNGTVFVAAGAQVVDTTLAGNKAAGSTTPHGTITIKMIDTGANQDNCKGLTVPLYLTAA